MNTKQKVAVLAGLSLIIITVILWLIDGGDFFTKTQVLVEKESTELDKLLGLPPQKEYQDKFVFGLLPPGLVASVEFVSASTISGLIAVISALSFFLFKSKKRKEIT